jgi:FkbM family methyltransferase
MNIKKLINDLFEDNNEINLLQIGANDGLQSDMFRESIIEYKIKSYLLEPVPEFYNLLVKNYSNYNWVECHNLAITTEDGKKEIKYVPKINDLPEWTMGLGTFDAEKNFLGSGKGGHGLSIDYSNTEIYKRVINEVINIEVKTNTLNTFIIENNIKDIDIYVSDTEGFDWIIFNQLDLEKFNPKIICMETHTLGDVQNKLIVDKLIEYGYDIIDKDWDTIAIKSVIKNESR